MQLLKVKDAFARNLPAASVICFYDDLRQRGNEGFRENVCIKLKIDFDIKNFLLHSAIVDSIFKLNH